MFIDWLRSTESVAIFEVHFETSILKVLLKHMSPSSPYKFQRDQNRSNDTKEELDLFYVDTNSYTQFSSQYLKRRQRKVQKTKFLQSEIAYVKVR